MSYGAGIVHNGFRKLQVDIEFIAAVRYDAVEPAPGIAASRLFDEGFDYVQTVFGQAFIQFFPRSQED